MERCGMYYEIKNGSELLNYIEVKEQCHNYKPNVPYYKWTSYYCTLSEEIHQWLTDMDIPYQYGYVYNGADLYIGDDIIEEHGLSNGSFIIDMDEPYHTIFKLRWE